MTQRGCRGHPRTPPSKCDDSLPQRSANLSCKGQTVSALQAVQSAQQLLSSAEEAWNPPWLMHKPKGGPCSQYTRNLNFTLFSHVITSYSFDYFTTFLKNVSAMSSWWAIHTQAAGRIWPVDGKPPTPLLALSEGSKRQSPCPHRPERKGGITNSAPRESVSVPSQSLYYDFHIPALPAGNFSYLTPFPLYQLTFLFK